MVKYLYIILKNINIVIIMWIVFFSGSKTVFLLKSRSIIRGNCISIVSSYELVNFGIYLKMLKKCSIIENIIFEMKIFKNINFWYFKK